MSEITGVAASMAGSQGQVSLLAVKLAIESQQRMVELLAGVAEAGQVVSANPAHLGNLVDTRA